MRKLIIDNRTDLPDVDAIFFVREVMRMGRVSNDDKQYCYATTFQNHAGRFDVVTDLNAKSDRFVIVKSRSNDGKTKQD